MRRTALSWQLGISKLRLPAGKRPGSQSHADQQLAKKCQLEDDFQPCVVWSGAEPSAKKAVGSGRHLSNLLPIAIVQEL